MSDWKRYDEDSLNDFSSEGINPDISPFEGELIPEEPDEEIVRNNLFLNAIQESIDSLKSKKALYRYAEGLGNQDAPVSDQHRQELSVFIDELFESMDVEIGTMENAFKTLKNAFPCLNRLDSQLSGSRFSFPEVDQARYITDTIREGLYQHDYRDDWKDMPADILINGWRALLFFSQIWPQYHVKQILTDMLEYMYTRPDIIEYCRKGKNDDRPEEV